ncbi:hypothetical protein [Virgisporangium aurantiacum]|uniref:Serine active site containing 1-like protein n=1 Tax=Virgisporangium aurantiacum TaxID=175570 RepID=A0A8J3ZF46_9ACTN|nr:hypothetical protein [Virgisporangium aurantiacum]GIJ60645.1 hypothetical protein Vau01_081610 [Virgisporangium aurantiacum]
MDRITARRALVIGIVAGFLITGVIALSDRWLPRPDFLPDTGSSWYRWQRPERSAAVMFGAWTLYALHQVGFWALIWYGQRRVGRYTGTLHRVNVAALAWNGFFVAVHFVQTQAGYDGLAQDVSIWTSQWSVIVLLVWVLLMEEDRRGLFFGRPVPTPGGRTARDWARRYHGYYFAWAAVYTFWFHPMETTSGHLIGFLYMFLILLQGSLFLTRAHVDRRWTVVLEVLVLFHGFLVALNSPKQLWFQFGWGFATVFVVTQMHGLGWPRWAQWATGIGYVVSVAAVVAWYGTERLAQLPRVPVAEYALVFVLAGLIAGGLAVTRRVRKPQRDDVRV